MQKSCFSYPVEFTDDAFGASAALAETLRTVTGSETPKVLIVADMNVVQRTEGLGTKIGRYVQAHGIRLAGSPVVVAGGEKVKADSLQSAMKVVSAILSARLGRNDAVLVLGGGTVIDVAGYSAAQVRGGVKLVRMPTTPAAMLDAAYADFAAVDSATVKDALRVPSVPSAVVVDVGFAATVLDGVWRSGIGEAVRQAVGLDAALLKKLSGLAPAYRGRDVAALAEIVRLVCASRAKKGTTALAQWAAMRLEAMSGYKLPHGYAVAIGLCVDLRYSVELGLLKADDCAQAAGLLQDSGALDGLAHSCHLLGQAESLLLGLDDWALAAGSPTVDRIAKLGKTEPDAAPDRAVLTKVFGQVAALAGLTNHPTPAR